MQHELTHGVLNPEAGLNEVLLSDTLAGDVQPELQRFAREVLAALDATDKQVLDRYVFWGDPTQGVPSHTGYYLGMLAAAHIAQQYGLGEAARLQGDPLRAAIERGFVEITARRHLPIHRHRGPLAPVGTAPRRHAGRPGSA